MGWVDDELSVFQPWGFDPAAITAPAVIWNDPNDPVLPVQHAEWVARTVPGATLVRSDSLGHGSSGDPTTDWIQLYSWLAEAHPQGVRRVGKRAKCPLAPPG